MAKGISIAVASDTKDFVAGVAKGTVELENMQAAIEDVSAASTDSGEKLEQVFKEQQEESAKLTKAQKELSRAVEETSSRGSRSLKKNYGQALDETSKGFDELKSEATQNLSQLASSFSGDMTQVADAVQGTIGGLVSGLGPAGLIVTSALAAGVGVFMAELEKAEERENKFKEAVAETTAELLEQGAAGKVSYGYIAEKLKEIVITTDPASLNLKKIREEAARIGVPVKELAQSYSGLNKNIDEQIRKTKEQIELTRAAAKAQAAYSGQDYLNYQALNSQLQALEDVKRAAEEAARAQEGFYEIGAAEAAVKAAAIDSVNDSYDRAASAADSFIKKESGVFDTSAYIKAMKHREKALRDFQENLAQADLSDDAKRWLAEQGAETAAAMVKGYKEASPKQKKELNRIWSEAAEENSGEYVTRVQKALENAQLLGPKVELEPADTSKWVRQVERDLKQRRLSLDIDVKTKFGSKIT